MQFIEKSHVDNLDARKHLDFNLLKSSSEFLLTKIDFSIPLINFFRIYRNTINKDHR